MYLYLMLSVTQSVIIQGKFWQQNFSRVETINLGYEITPVAPFTNMV